MIVTLAARGFQLLFAAVVLGLSVSLITGFGPTSLGGNKDKMPESTLIIYGAFCGALGLLVSLIGIAACFVEAIQGIIILALDGLSAFFFAAGGIAFAVKTGVGSCSDGRLSLDTYLNKHVNLFRPSQLKFTNDSSRKDIFNELTSRCRMVQADTAFIWLMFGMVVVTAALSIFGKSGKRGGAIV
ncbi:hypothetical protein HYALB_00012094 [Hymenoscyphus albidus]|uniref:MARVEL domain-containing protein n=1 Tax=Hymenoscyphus albidus TaxID=595503 RepID=A0A9N9Q5Z8_9HELO|nr:hypothetical protein HYALB_00012094 [Hymenoscyphus albidus]